MPARRRSLAIIALLACCARSTTLHAEGAPTDGEIWNEGVGFYESGDVTNALARLRPLMLSKTHGPRAAELVAKMERDRGNLEEAAFAAQIALRANPGDARVNRNFTRAADGVREKREADRVNAVLKAAQGKDPGAAMHESVKEARFLFSEAGGYRTNRAEKAVALADAFSKRAGRLADSWLPLRETIAQSVTNEEQAATILAQIDEAQAHTRRAEKDFADFSADAYGSIGLAEQDFTRFFKLIALPPAAIEEDSVSQSNAWTGVETVNGRAWQQDALDYTRAFREKFPAWAKAYEQQAAADTNKPPFTAEDQAKVSALSTELEKVQIGCCEKSLPDMQEKAIDLIRQIRELLPKDGGGQGGSDSQNQDQNQGQNQNQDQSQDQEQGQDQNRNEPEERQGDQEEKPQEGEEKEDRDEKEDPAVDAVLRKAQERSDEHEADKKARMRKAPLPPNERDW